MIYARVHDQTVADDYYAAMQKVEQRLDLLGEPENTQGSITEDERTQLLALTEQLAAPELGTEIRLEIVAQMRQVLLGNEGIPISVPAFQEAIPV